MKISSTDHIHQSIIPQDEKDFGHFARPLTAKLLSSMELSKNYVHGNGDYLFYKKNNLPQKVLDLTGGYGANFLGHRHPRLLSKLQQWQNEGAPNLTQGSVRHSSGLLAKRLSETLQLETSEGPWISTFSNSGAEAIEAAIKHCLLYFNHRMIKINQVVEKEINQANLFLNQLDSESRDLELSKLKKNLAKNLVNLKIEKNSQDRLLDEIENIHNHHLLINLVREINEKQLSQRPLLVALEKSYHGKSMGALAITSNQSFKDPFYVNEEFNPHIKFISPYIGQETLNHFIESTYQDILILSVSKKEASWSKQSFSLIAGVFVEPIQGEAGIVPVSDSFLAYLKKYSIQEDFLLVFDEIQSGIYRTGTLAAATHTHITPDIYTFSKTLGGGIAKIAATTIIQRKCIEEFGFLHTSTFSDDDFSASIALEVLNILQDENSPLNEGMRVADYLWGRLEWLKDTYPLIIHEIRGKGLMLSIEFHDIFHKMGFEFKSICDSKMQGHGGSG